METIAVQTGRDFGCPMTEADMDSYVALVEQRLQEIYGMPATMTITGGGDTRCTDCPDTIDPSEVARFVGVELWEEWCRATA